MGTPVEGGEVQGTGPEITDESAPGQNPAWSEVLGVIPESLHQAVTPHFQQWDQAAQQRIESVNQQLQQFDPYKPFVENEISPEDLEQGLQLMYQLNTNPQGVYQALAEAYGYGAQNVPNGQENGTGEEEEDPAANFQDPRFDQLQQGLDIVAQTMLQQQQEKIDQAAEQQVDAELKQLEQKYPGISQEFALSLMVNGFDVNAVGQKWEQMTQSVLQQNPRPFAPNVLGASGGGTGLPSQAVDVTKLSDNDRRALVARMAQAQMSD